MINNSLQFFSFLKSKQPNKPGVLCPLH